MTFIIPGRLHNFICLIRPRGCKKNFMCNSAQHELLNAHRYETVKNSFFSGSDKPRIVGISIYVSRKNLMLS